MVEQTLQEVEFIPWAHHPFAKNHIEVLNYLRTLPKNSHLALEIDYIILRKFEEYYNWIQSRVMEKAGRGEFGVDLENNEFDRKIREYVYGAHEGREWIAFYDVLVECKRRNISIIPLEPFRQFGATEENTKSYRREGIFAQRLNTALKKFRAKKLYVLTGGDHTDYIPTNLVQLNSKLARVKFSFKDTPLKISKWEKIWARQKLKALIKKGAIKPDPKFDELCRTYGVGDRSENHGVGSLFNEEAIRRAHNKLGKQQREISRRK